MNSTNQPIKKEQASRCERPAQSQKLNHDKTMNPNCTPTDHDARIANTKRRTLQNFNRAIDKMLAMQLIDSRQALAIEEIILRPIEDKTQLPADVDVPMRLAVIKVRAMLQHAIDQLGKNYWYLSEWRSIDWEFGQLMLYNDSGANSASGSSPSVLLAMFAHHVVQSLAPDGLYTDVLERGAK